MAQHKHARDAESEALSRCYAILLKAAARRRKRLAAESKEGVDEAEQQHESA